MDNEQDNKNVHVGINPIDMGTHSHSELVIVLTLLEELKKNHPKIYPIAVKALEEER